MKRLLLILLFMLSWNVHASDNAPPLPARAGEWLDGKPLSWTQLKGNVVLLNVWTFG